MCKICQEYASQTKGLGCMAPAHSIVTANYNFGRFLEDAIRSILAQGMGTRVEIIVCDAASTDNSIEVIKKYDEFIAWWCSEKDGGQSEAFNKGFAHARGKYLTWLNADDIMPPGCLKKVLAEMKAHPDCEWFTANHLRFLDSDKAIIQVEWGPHIYPKFLQRKNSPLVVFGPTTFFAKTAYERVGRIDESLHFAMDTDLWLRMQAAGIKQRRINSFCWAFRMHEKSKTAEYIGHKHVSNGPGPKLMAEHQRAATKIGYSPSRILRWLQLFFRVLDGSLIQRYILRRRLLGKSIN